MNNTVSKIKLSKIKTRPDNPRVIKDDKFKKLVQSLIEFPVMTELREVLLDEDNIIIGGNMRYKAAKQAGWKEISYKYFTREDAERNNILTKQNKTYEEYVEELVVKDNVSGGEWDWDILANKHEPAILDAWGLDLPDKSILEPEIEEDEAPEVSSEPSVSELGKIYQLGKHRVMCGDSTNKISVELLMDGVKADMVFTDPPYGMDLDTDYSQLPSTKKEGNKTYSKVIGDDKEFNFQDYNWIDCAEQIWFGANYYAKTLPNGGSWIVWDKRVEKKFDKMFGSGFEIAWSKTPHKQKIYRHNNTLFGGDSEARGKEHPTQKPTKLCYEIIKDIGNDKDLVVDLFLGSGSTLIACEQTDRTCYGMELDPKYVDVIRKRYAKFCYPDTWEERWEELTPEISEGTVNYGS